MVKVSRSWLKQYEARLLALLNTKSNSKSLTPLAGNFNERIQGEASVQEAATGHDLPHGNPTDPLLPERAPLRQLQLLAPPLLVVWPAAGRPQLPNGRPLPDPQPGPVRADRQRGLRPQARRALGQEPRRVRTLQSVREEEGERAHSAPPQTHFRPVPSLQPEPHLSPEIGKSLVVIFWKSIIESKSKYLVYLIIC